MCCTYLHRNRSPIVSYPRDFLGPERMNLGQKQQNTPDRPTGPEKKESYHILAEDKFPGEKEFVGAAGANYNNECVGV